MARRGAEQSAEVRSGGGASVTDQAVAWFVRLGADDVTAREREAFRRWRDADPAHAEAYRRVEAMWDSPAFDEAVGNASRSLPAPGARQRWQRVAAAAAALVLALIAAHYAELPLRLQADHMTATGEQRRVELASGAQVVLDTRSAIAAEDGGQRVRLLKGRAYFDIALAPGRPFRVRAGPARVEVTGTAFALALEDGGATVTLRRGAVVVSATGADGERVRLRPGRQLRVAGARTGTPAPVDLAEALGWVGGRLVFADRPLEEVVARLRRYHAGAIVIADERVGRTRITGNYRLDDPARTAARLAELASAELTRLSDRLLILH